MPRDLTKELVELKQGLHQFIMSMYNILDKLVESNEAKHQLIKVLQEEIGYIKSTDGEYSEDDGFIAFLTKYKNIYVHKLESAKDEHSRYTISEVIGSIETIIENIDKG